MKNYKYKVFFTISFLFKVDKRKTITKSFKSDINFNSINSSLEINDKNVYDAWKNYALKAPLYKLNPPCDYIDKNVSEKKITTHRIVNLINLTEVFYN